MSPDAKESQIPVGTQFSPDLINLPAFVKMVIEHSGNIEELRKAVVERPVRIKSYGSPPTQRMKGLPLEAGVQYGLLTEGTYQATDLAKELATLKEPEIYEVFARHILLNLNGLRVVDAAQQMAQDRCDITGDTLCQYLTDQGFRVSIHNTAINTMRMWLALADLFPKGKGKDMWMPNKTVKEKLLGMSDEIIAALAGFTEEQIAFIRVLCSLEPEGWIPASEIRDMAETTFGVRFGRASLPKEVLEPLRQAELIDYETRGTKSGKTSRLKLTEKFNSEVLKLFIDSALKNLNSALTSYYLTRPEDIFASLYSRDKYVKGRALEAFAIYVMRLLGLKFIGWRHRAKDTGYSEVDALLAGLFGGLPTTWQVQCKNTPKNSVRLEDVAKEVGLLPLTHATHILIAANTTFTEDACKYADEIMSTSSVNIFLLNKKDIEAIKENPTNISYILKTKAERIRDLHTTSTLWGGIERLEKQSRK
jgi:site-specific DNA-methyltransferase (cytosine-N4-specific)